MAVTRSSKRKEESSPQKPSSAAAEKFLEKEEKVANDDLSPHFLARPHSISTLVAILAVLLYVALYRDMNVSVNNVISGLIASSLVFLFIGILFLPNGPFIRPHPSFWKGVMALSIVYVLFLVFLLFQDKNDARKWLGWIDPSLGTKLPERSYAEACDLTWDNVVSQLDIFIVAHIVGWYVKALLLRDAWFCHILSVLFELMEYSLEHQLPNFAECWWDHWILDALVCNWLGIYLGMKTCKYLEMKVYSWRGYHEITTYRGKVARTVKQFTPHSWTAFHWGPTKNIKNFVAVLCLLTLYLIGELNAFYLKYLLWVPPEHYLNPIRLIIHSLSAAAGTREIYQYLTDPACKNFGPQAWIVIAAVVTETLICIKYGIDEFTEPFPLHVIVFWSVALGVLTIWAIWHFSIKKK